MPEHKGSSYAGRREKGTEPAGRQSQLPDGDKRATIKEIKICLFGLGDELPWDAHTMFAFYSYFVSYLLWSARGEPSVLFSSPPSSSPPSLLLYLFLCLFLYLSFERVTARFRWNGSRQVHCAHIYCEPANRTAVFSLRVSVGLLLKERKEKNKGRIS